MRKLDPVTFEVLRSAVYTICDEVGDMLERAAYSPAISEARDSTGSILDSDGNLVGHGLRDQSVHLGTFELTCKTVLREIGPENFKAGDIVIYNDPYTGGTHNNDVRMVMPLIFEGELVALITALGHWPDIGGVMPGTFYPAATDSFAEGLRIPPIKIVERGRLNKHLLNLLLANVRMPGERIGDVHAQIQALRLGNRRLSEYFRKYGKAVVKTAFKEIYDHSERMLREEITKHCKPGVYEFTQYIDQDPATIEKKPIMVHLKLTVNKVGDLVFDFTESDPAPKGAVGSCFSTTCSGVYVTLLTMFPLGEFGIRLNHGIIRMMDIKTKPGSVVHLLPPSPFSGMAAGGYEKVTGCVLGAIGLAAPEKKSGVCYNLENLTMGGWDPRLNRYYVMYLWLQGGFGASKRGDRHGIRHMLFATGLRNQPVEVLERYYPVIFERSEIMRDSQGAGKWQGGAAEVRVWKLTHGPATLTILGDREKFPPWGVEGGGDSVSQTVILNPSTDKEKWCGMYGSGIPIEEGDVTYYRSSGGGGYGNPLERDPKAVLQDVINDYLSIEQAAEKYGVIIRPVDPDANIYEIDFKATTARRETGTS